MLASRVGIAVAIASVLVTAAAAAQPVVSGRAIFSYQVFDEDNLSSHGLHQIYDANYDRTVLDPLRLRLSFRGEGANATTTSSGTDHKNSYWLLQPGGEVDYNLPTLHFQGQYDLYDTKSSTDALDGARRQERGIESLLWSPDRAPSLTLQGFQTGNRDVAAGVDDKENRLLESLNYLWRGFTFTQTAHWADFRQSQSGFDRKSLDLQGQVQYQSVRADGRASVTGYAIAGVSRLDEASPVGNVLAPTQAAIASALYTRDDTPLDARDNPPVPDIRLIDGNFSTRTDIAVGPSAPLYQNLVFDMGRVIAIDTFRVFVRDPSGNFVPAPGLLRWDVFISGDALDWTPVIGGAQTSFIGALSAYEVAFAKASSRFFKIVSFGTASQDAFVTELQAFFHSEFAKGETRRTDVRFVSTNLDATVRPLSWLALRYYGLANIYSTTQPDRPDYNSHDTDHQVSLLLAPDQPLNGNIRYERRDFSSAGSQGQTLDGLWGVLQWAINRNLQTTLEASRTSEHGDTELVADTIRLHEYVRLFRTIELSVDGGVQQEDFGLLNLSARQVFVNGVGYVQLTNPLRLTVNVNYDKTRFTGTGTASLIDLEPTTSRYYGELSFRPSGQLLLSGRLGYVTAPGVSATTKTYRIEWYPFARGTVGFGTIFDEDVETNGTYRRFRRIQILPRWLVNQHVTVDVNYNYLTLLDGGNSILRPVESKTKQLYVNLTWIL